MQKRWTLRSRPVGMVEVDNFNLEHVEIPEPGPGMFLVEALYLTMNPPAYTWLTTGGMSGKPVQFGELMRGSGLGRVVRSRNSNFAEGDLVVGPIGWQEYCLSDGERVNPMRKVSVPEGLPVSTLLHVLGASGASAWFGLNDIGKLKDGETLVVSGAAGSVGSIVCQLGKLKGSRVIGIAGSERKCRWLVDELGCDHAINYKEDDVATKLHELAPGAIDVFFDNVGGPTLDAALAEIARGARIVLCGGTSQYVDKSGWRGPENYFNLVYREATMSGFYVYSYSSRFAEPFAGLSEGIRRGEIKYAEDLLVGIEQAPNALRRLLLGENFGTTVIKVKDL